MKRVVTVILILTMIAALLPTAAFAVPYNTYTSGPEGSFVPTQTAYLPTGKLNFSGADSLSMPEDMKYDAHSGYLYITDSGNGRIIVSNLDSTVVARVGEGTLSKPTGIAVTEEKLYVADKGNKSVYVFDKVTYALEKTITKPSSPLVGDNVPFVPTRLSVDSRGNIYVVSEGSVNGIMQLNSDGEFIANVGANKTPSGFKSIVQQLFYSEQQISQFFATPRSPTNISIDSKGLIYTVTNNARSDAIKKLNSLGAAIMSPPSVREGSTTALTVDSEGNIYGTDSYGYVTVYNSYGGILFTFGGKSDQERLGNLSSPTAVAVTENNLLLVLDKEYAMVLVYERTEFAELVFLASSYYKDGLYIEGEPYWQEVLRYNSSFIVAYSALARANMKRGNYTEALEQFRLAEDKDGYSDAYWQIRNDWLQKNLGTAICILLVVIVLVALLKFLDKRNEKVLRPLRNIYGKVEGVTLIKQLFHLRRFTKAPQDAVYEIKYHGAASLLSASLLYVWFIVLQILSVVIKGYLFSDSTVYNTNGAEVILYSTLPLLLLILANYFVSTVSDGEGKLRYCYIVFIYALAPYLLMALPIFIVSNVLTYNEQIVYTLLNYVMYGWSAVNLFLALSELHDYNLWQTVKNVLLTVFAAAMAVLFVIVLRMLLAQLFGYFGQLFREIFQ